MPTFLNSILAVLLSCSAAFAGDSIPPDTAALVNGAVVSTADYRSELARILRQRKKTVQELDQAALALTKKESLETLIGRELLYQESVREGIKVKDTEVDAEIARLQGQFPGEDEFIASLGKLELTKEAVTAQIKRGMAIQALLDSRFSATKVVTEPEARNYYEKNRDAYSQPVQIRLSHILIKPAMRVTGSGTTSARSTMDSLQRRLSKGEDFALLARESDDSASSEKGGDLGYFTPGQLGKKLEDAAFSQAVGQVSPIIEDRFGFHLLKVTERRPKTALPFEEVREKVSKQLQRERMMAEMTPYLKRLRDVARVEIHLAGE
jgi:parvulin-like peptidyl-prolyl isomerase